MVPFWRLIVPLHDLLMPTPEAVDLGQPVLEHKWRIFGRPGETVDEIVLPAFAVVKVLGLHLQPGAFREAARKNAFDLHVKVEGLIRIDPHTQQIGDLTKAALSPKLAISFSPPV